MTVTGHQSSPLCLFRSKVEDALLLVPNMGAEEKLGAVQFWNIVSEKLQEIVNNSAADINALTMNLDDGKKLPLQVDNSTVSDEAMYSSEFVNGAAGYVVCPESSSQCISENLNSQNSHYIHQNGSTFPSFCYSESTSAPNSVIPQNTLLRPPETEPIDYVKSLPSSKCTSSINGVSDSDLIDFTLANNDVTLNDELINDASKCSPPPPAVGKSNARQTRQKDSKQSKLHEKSDSNSDIDQALSSTSTSSSSNEFCPLSAMNEIQQTISHSGEDPTVDTSLESACSSLSDGYDIQNKEEFTTIDEKLLKMERGTAESAKCLPMAESCDLICDWCEQEFPDSLSLDTHRWTHTKPFICTECDAQFSSKGNLMVHFRRHTGEKPYNCSTCPARFSTRGNLRRHMKVHSGDKPHECLQCGSRFTEKKSLKVHMRRHTGEKPYGCKICGKCFSQSGILQAHMAVHLNERAHLCEHCGKAFRQKSQLRVHKLRHQGVRNYTCQSCPARFLTKGDLERHTRVHTGERPFICDLCKKTFTRQQSLKEHLNRHYGLKPFRCKHCGKSFAEMSACYKHAKQHEKVSKSDDGQIVCQQDVESSSLIRISSAKSLNHSSNETVNSEVEVA